MIHVWSGGNPCDSMPEPLLLELAHLVRRHPWWHARASLVGALLRSLEVRPGARILDAGCGWGVTLEALEARGYTVVGLDLSRAALERLDGPGRTLIQADLAAPVRSSAGATFDAVLALDVIEHLDDDRAAISRLASLLRPGGALILSVPARPDLWSAFDDAQCHRRRYLPETLLSAIDSLLFDTVTIRWWGGWMVPLLARRRRAASPGESPLEIYKRGLQLPHWPSRLVLKALFARSHLRALANRESTGTSLILTAHRRHEILGSVQLSADASTRRTAAARDSLTTVT
jgi:SAM-dependent methyltransferase